MNCFRSFSIGESKGGVHETYKKQLTIRNRVCWESFVDLTQATWQALRVER